MEINQKKLVIKFIPIIQARMGSNRLPGKSLMNIGNYKLIDWVIEYAKENFSDELIFLATTNSQKDDSLVKYLRGKNINIFRGSESDVFSRFERISKKFDQDDIIVRITGDNPIKYNSIIQKMKSKILTDKIDYCCLENLSKLSVEFIRIKLIDQIKSMKYFDKFDKEHVTWNIRNKLNCNKLIIDQTKENMRPEIDRLITIDNAEDILFVEKLIKKLNLRPGKELSLINLYKSINE